MVGKHFKGRLGGCPTIQDRFFFTQVPRGKKNLACVRTWQKWFEEVPFADELPAKANSEKSLIPITVNA